MTFNQFSKALEKALDDEKFQAENFAEKIAKITNLSFRTSLNLINRYLEFDPIDYNDFDYSRLLKPSFYTLENCEMLYRRGYEDLIPTSIYLSKEFINTIGIYAIPEAFDCSDKTLETVFIPSEIRYICKFAFAGCSNLREIIYENPNLKRKIDESAFWGTKIK